MSLMIHNHLMMALGSDIESASSNIVKRIKMSRSGYAGFAEKEFLEWYVKNELRDFRGEKVVALPFNAAQLLEKSYQDCGNLLKPLDDMEVYIFPTADDFVLKEMNGFSGFTPYEGVIHIFVHIWAGEVASGNKFMESTFVHEYVHAVRSKYISYDGKSNILDSLIHEGLAENFAEKICGSKYTLSKVFPKKELESYMERTAPILDSVDSKDYKDIFYGGERFQQWTGYTLGYYLVKKYLEKIESSDWNEIVKLPSQEFILEK